MKPPEATVIRVPTLADASEIAVVHVQSWREAYSHLLRPTFFDQEVVRNRTRMWRELLAREQIPDRLRVVESEGRIVGVALASTPPDGESARDLHLYLIYILARVYGTGIGQALLDAVIGDEPAQLWVARDNPRAIAFYRRNGFAPDGVEMVDPELDDLAEIRLVR